MTAESEDPLPAGVDPDILHRVVTGEPRPRTLVKAHWSSEGSVFAGNLVHRHSVEIHTGVESSDDAALIAAVIRNAQGG